MVYNVDIPTLKKTQGNECKKETIAKGGCDGMFYDPREDCPGAADSQTGVYSKEGFDACDKARCTWTVMARFPNGPERLCIPF